MDKNGPKMMRGAMMSGCGMWAPIIPPASESKSVEGPRGVALDSRLCSTPIPITISSSQTAKAKTFKSV
jgi:hypothetical protein